MRHYLLDVPSVYLVKLGLLHGMKHNLLKVRPIMENFGLHIALCSTHVK